MDTLPDNPRAVIGANNPPEPIEFERLSVEANERIDVANRWLTERPEITDAEMADRAAGFEAQLRGTTKALDDARRAEKKPLEDQLKAIDARYRPLTDLLAKAKDMIVARRNAWLRAEEVRLAREKAAAEAEARRRREEAAAAQRRAEEAARQAGADALRAQQAAEDAARRAAAAEQVAAKAPEKAVIKGDYTARAVGLRSNWTAVVTDEAAALRSYGKHPVVRKAALEAALKLAIAEAKAAKDPNAAKPGFRFYDAAREAA
ncbi:MAG TPA: hypothetical protein VHA07_10010 [Devosia sp.]|nr:hypothetical protein [Devosia sp.]